MLSFLSFFSSFQADGATDDKSIAKESYDRAVKELHQPNIENDLILQKKASSLVKETLLLLKKVRSDLASTSSSENESNQEEKERMTVEQELTRRKDTANAAGNVEQSGHCTYLKKQHTQNEKHYYYLFLFLHEVTVFLFHLSHLSSPLFFSFLCCASSLFFRCFFLYWYVFCIHAFPLFPYFIDEDLLKSYLASKEQTDKEGAGSNDDNNNNALGATGLVGATGMNNEEAAADVESHYEILYKKLLRGNVKMTEKEQENMVESMNEQNDGNVTKQNKDEVRQHRLTTEGLYHEVMGGSMESHVDDSGATGSDAESEDPLTEATGGGEEAVESEVDSGADSKSETAETDTSSAMQFKQETTTSRKVNAGNPYGHFVIESDSR